MSNTLKLGNGKWATGKDTLLAYNDLNSNYKPLAFSFSRGTNATVVNEQGLIELVGSDEPRIDFKDNTKGSLLLEPTRSNLLPYSGNFSTWAEVFAVGTISDIISPNGTDYGIKITDNNVSNTHRIQLGVTTASSGSFTYSLFLKKGTLTTAYFQVFSGTTASNANVDLENGTITSGGFGVNHTIEDYGNDWYRCSISGTLTSTSTTVYLYTKQNGSYVGNGDYLYAWGSQLEQGSYATSYIPTNGSAATRVADVCNNGANEQVINSTEGVLYVEANLINGYDTNNWLGIIYDSSNANNRIYIQRYLGNIQSGIRVNGVIQSEITESSSSLGKNKIAFSYKLNEFKMFVNGSQVGTTITSGSVFTPNTLDKCNVGVYHNNTLNFNNVINDFRLYNTALTDQQLIALTTI